MKTTKEKLFNGYFKIGELFAVETECGLEITLARAEKDERKAQKIWCPIHQRLEYVSNVQIVKSN